MEGKHYNNIRYAGDTALLAGNEKELSELTSKINEVGKQFGMKINIKKINAMVVSNKPNSPKINIVIDGQKIEQVTCYMVYLGSLITEDGRSEKDIKRRKMIAWTTFTNMRTLLSCRGINLKTRLRAIKCYVWHYYMEQRHGQLQNHCYPDLMPEEVWKYRRALKISWTEKITNEAVLRRMGTGREIVRQFKTMKLQYLGHHIWSNSSQLQLIEGNIEGRIYHRKVGIDS